MFSDAKVSNIFGVHPINGMTIHKRDGDVKGTTTLSLHQSIGYSIFLSLKSII